MRTTIVVVLGAALAAVSSGCFAGESHFRTADGEPVPTYTRMDSLWKPAPVRCGGEVYYLVDEPNSSMSGMRIRREVPNELADLEAATFCERVKEVDSRIAETDD